MSDSRCYTKLLASKGLGYPLWHPQPIDSLPNEYKREGVRIGDVGYINDRGAFSFLFNICCDADDLINLHFGVPDGFQKLDLDPGRSVERIDVAFSPGSEILTETIQTREISFGVELNGAIPVEASAGVELSCSSAQGAALLLPDGASSSDLLPLDAFKEYILLHGKSWFTFLKKQHRPVQDLNIYLVTGCDKTASWGVATFSKSTRIGQVSMKFGPSGVASGHAKYKWDKSSYGYGFAQAGPHRRPGEEAWGENQCVFIRGFTVAMQHSLASKEKLKVEAIRGSNSQVQATLCRGASRWWSFQKGRLNNKDSSGSQHSSEKSPSDSELYIQYSSEVTKPYHPSNILNDYLLNSTTIGAISFTHDSTWMSVMDTSDTSFPDDMELLNRICMMHEVVNTPDATYFILPDKIQHHHSDAALGPSESLGLVPSLLPTHPSSTGESTHYWGISTCTSLEGHKYGTAFHDASVAGHFDTVRLHEQGTDPNIPGDNDPGMALQAEASQPMHIENAKHRNNDGSKYGRAPPAASCAGVKKFQNSASQISTVKRTKLDNLVARRQQTVVYHHQMWEYLLCPDTLWKHMPRLM
ncbi:hypothetical protein C8R44DRAFT_709038 [Mycena epipterygia]|nr:hypothetical protein C8R44DRAFT_709038 [Mycena epipterygia]